MCLRMFSQDCTLVRAAGVIFRQNTKAKIKQTLRELKVNEIVIPCLDYILFRGILVFILAETVCHNSDKFLYFSGRVFH